jgi:uncharacterized protein (TIGR00106 family)
MVLMNFSIFPLGKGESVGAYVARVAQLVDESGLPYQLHAMGTTVEGELDSLLKLLKACFDELSRDCDRIVCTAYFDFRRGRTRGLEQKVASVERHLGRKLRGAVHAHSHETSAESSMGPARPVNSEARIRRWANRERRLAGALQVRTKDDDAGTRDRRKATGKESVASSRELPAKGWNRSALSCQVS